MTRWLPFWIALAFVGCALSPGIDPPSVTGDGSFFSGGASATGGVVGAGGAPISPSGGAGGIPADGSGGLPLGGSGGTPSTGDEIISSGELGGDSSLGGAPEGGAGGDSPLSAENEPPQDQASGGGPTP